MRGRIRLWLEANSSSRLAGSPSGKEKRGLFLQPFLSTPETNGQKLPQLMRTTYKPWQDWREEMSVFIRPQAIFRTLRDFIWEGRVILSAGVPSFSHSSTLLFSSFNFFAPASTSRTSQTKCSFKKWRERKKRAGSWKTSAFALGPERTGMSHANRRETDKLQKQRQNESSLEE